MALNGKKFEAVPITDDLRRLSDEVKGISHEIALMKKQHKRLQPGHEKEELRETIKLKQYQALFYIEKIENLSKASKL